MLQLPEFKTELAPEAEIRRIKDYLYSLVEELRYSLTSIDTGNFTAETANKLNDAANKAESAGKTVIELSQGVNGNNKDLRDEIIRQANVITQNYTTLIQESEDRITSSVQEEYTAQTSTATLESTLRSLIDQTAEEIELTFSRADNYTKEIDNALQNFKDEFMTYIRFTLEGIELGDINSAFRAILSNTKLAFMQGMVEIAYISNNKMYITDAEITNKLTIGNSNSGYYDFILEANNSLSLVRR